MSRLSRSSHDNRRRTSGSTEVGAGVDATRSARRRRLLTLLARVMRQEPESYPKTTGGADGVLLAVLVALVAFGVLMVYSASAVLAYRNFDNGQYYLARQGIFALLGIPITVALARLDYHRLRPFAKPFLFASFALLVVTLAGYGTTAGGAARWIRVGSVHVQPAEIVKVAMIFWLAHSLSKQADRIRTFKFGVLPHLLVASVMMLLCYKQPDFGSAVMIGLLTAVLLFTAGARVSQLLAAGILAAPAVVYAVVGTNYRLRRWHAFLDPFAHRDTGGYQVAESMLSFGAGGITGVGIGDSRQKLFYLPEAHTDFIAAIVAEELGLIGLGALVFAYLVIVHRGIVAAFKAPDDYGTYLAVGISMFVGLQAFTNLAVAVGLLPTKGLVLPFMSYGGSSLLVNCAAVGVLLNVSRPRQAVAAPRETQAPRSGATPKSTPTSTPRARGNRLLVGGAL